MRKRLFTLILFCVALKAISQNANGELAARPNIIERPRLVVGIVIDQMRWDYLYRYYDRYLQDGGFKRLLSQGFSCENAFIPYAPTVTACGHASVYSGSVPAIDGITGNQWWDYDLSQIQYCTADVNTKTIGSATNAGQMSPRNLLVTTIGDELHLATNFRSKVIGIALKDRGAILAAGHSANGAYWYDDKTGDWISSSYYMTELPKWLKDLNAKKLVDQYYAKGWKTLYPSNTYVQSTPDQEPYENEPFGTTALGFPYDLNPFIGKYYGLLPVTPYGNSLTFDVAKAAVTGEHLGNGTSTDLLAISLSTPDYIGHSFGPNSVEAEDDFLRLDKDLGDFLKFLDQQVGKGQYLVFLTADHGVAHVPGFLKEHKIPAGSVNDKNIVGGLNKMLKDKYAIDNLVLGLLNYQIYLDRKVIDSAHLNKDSIYKKVTDFLLQQLGIARAFPLDGLNNTTLSKDLKNTFANGYFPARSGDIQVIFLPQWIEGFDNRGTTHGAWNPYDAHIPLLWFGWNVRTGKTNREVYMTDIAPTIAAKLHIQMPSGSIGHVIEEVAK